jgi:hypothetical protein
MSSSSQQQQQQHALLSNVATDEQETSQLLLVALEDALKDLNLYPEQHAFDSLGKLIRNDLASIALAKKLLNNKETSSASETNSWKRLGQEGNLPPWLTDPFLKGRPQLIAKLEALLFLSVKLQQEKLLEGKLAQAVNKPNELSTTITSASSQNQADAMELDNDDDAESPLSQLQLPSFLSEKQKTLIIESFCPLKADYDYRRRNMHKRLEILETNFDDQPVTTTTTSTTTGMNDSTALLLEHFSRAHSVNEHVVPSSIPENEVAAVNSSSSTSRNGRIDLEEEDGLLRMDMPAWTDERSEMPKSNNSQSHHHRKRGNGGPPHQKRKKTNDQNMG